MTTYKEFYTEVFNELDIPVNGHTLNAFAIVSILEGINSYWNPLNSVIKVTGSKDLPGNSAKVQMYADFKMGVAGTVALLKQPRWQWVVLDSQFAGNRNQILHEFDVQYQSWGSKLDWFSHTTPQANERLALTMKS